MYGVLFAWKKTRRGPSELKSSVTFAGPNGFGNGPTGFGAMSNGRRAGLAAQENASAAAEWPCVVPEVAICKRPRFVFRCRKRAAAAFFFTITIRGFAVLWLICSYGSCVPF